MNTEDALAAIKKVEKPNERERKEDDRRGRKREQTNHRIQMGINKKTIKPLDYKIHSFSCTC